MQFLEFRNWMEFGAIAYNSVSTQLLEFRRIPELHGIPSNSGIPGIGSNSTQFRNSVWIEFWKLWELTELGQ